MPVQLKVILLYYLREDLDSAFDACILRVQVPAKYISNLSHEICEAEKEI
jgi:hypothetical protein